MGGAFGTANAILCNQIELNSSILDGTFEFLLYMEFPFIKKYNSLNINESQWKSSIKPTFPFILAQGTNEYIFQLWQCLAL